MKTSCISWMLLAALVSGCEKREPSETKRTATVDLQSEVANRSNAVRESFADAAKLQVKTELEKLQDRAEQGDTEAQLELGEKFLKGDGIQENHPKAVSWFRKAAESGNAKAQFTLAQFYSKVENPDKLEVLKWFQKAADQRYDEAQLRLAVMHHTGDGVTKNMEKAVDFYQKAADQGNATARFLLGEIYLNGDGVPKDDRRGTRLLIMADVDGDYAPAKVAFASLTNHPPRLIADEREVLQGLPGVWVLVEGLRPEVENSGLDTNRLQTAVELKLRTLGIKVFTRDAHVQSGAPELYVNVNASKSKSPSLPIFVYSVKLSLQMDVLTEAFPTMNIIGATVWQRSSVGWAGEQKFVEGVVESVGLTVDEFANDFLAANPKQ